MNQLEPQLPWRVAALAALVVGVASGVTGADLWECLRRAGIAFLLFGVLGYLFRTILVGMAGPPDDRHKGRRLDHSTPPMTAADLNVSEEKPGHRDETKQ